MTKGKQHYKDRTVSDCPVDVFAANNLAMMDYPLRLGNVKPGSSSPGVASRSTYILDSAISEPELTNHDVLARAEELDADYIVPADVMGDREKTTDRTIEMFCLVDEYGVGDAEIIVPLQHCDETSGRTDSYDNDHAEHYDILSDHIPIEDHKIAIGGIVGWDATDQIATAIEVREHTGLGQDIHGLGMGFDKRTVAFARSCPWTLDSVDNSSSSKQLNTGTMYTPQLDTMDYRSPRGENSTFLSALLMEHNLYMLNHLLGPNVKEEDTMDVGMFPEIETLTVAHTRWHESQ